MGTRTRREDRRPTLKRETLRNLDPRVLTGEELAGVAGGAGTDQPRKSISCCCKG